MTKAKQRTIGAVVGANVRRLREAQGLTADDVATRARRWGLPWTRSTVASLENGGRKIDLGEVQLLRAVLGVRLQDLLAGDEMVRLTKDAAMQLSVIRDLYADRPMSTTPLMDVDVPLFRMKSITPAEQAKWRERSKVQEPLMGPHVTPAALQEAEKASSGLAEQRCAHKLGVDPIVLSYAAFGLWERSLTDERDFRAGPGASPAIRGAVTRNLLREISQRLAEEGVR